jgi:hypothetical protein
MIPPFPHASFGENIMRHGDVPIFIFKFPNEEMGVKKGGRGVLVVAEIVGKN